jgi:hypothetical protein
MGVLDEEYVPNSDILPIVADPSMDTVVPPGPPPPWGSEAARLASNTPMLTNMSQYAGKPNVLLADENTGELVKYGDKGQEVFREQGQIPIKKPPKKPSADQLDEWEFTKMALEEESPAAIQYGKDKAKQYRDSVPYSTRAVKENEINLKAAEIERTESDWYLKNVVSQHVDKFKNQRAAEQESIKHARTLAENADKQSEKALADDRKYDEINTRLTLKKDVSEEEKAWAGAYEKRKTLPAEARNKVFSNVPTSTPGIAYDRSKQTWFETDLNGDRHDLNSAEVMARTLQYKEDMPTNDIKVMQQSVPSVLQLIRQSREDMKNALDSLGPLAGRWSELSSGKVGASNPEYRKLQTDIGLLQTRLMKMHVGARGGVEMMTHFKNYFNAAKDSPENLEAAFNAVETYANEVGLPLKEQKALGQGGSGNSNPPNKPKTWKQVNGVWKQD